MGFLRSIRGRLARARAVRVGFRVERGTKVDPRAIVRPKRRGDITLGEGTKIHPYALLASHGGLITLGRFCSVNSFAVLYGRGGLTIGDDIRIAAHAVIVPANHVFADPDAPIRTQGLTKEGVVIERDV